MLKNFKIPKDTNLESMLNILNRDGKQYGWYFWYKTGTKRKKVDFGGTRETIEQSKQRAIEFLKLFVEDDE